MDNPLDALFGPQADEPIPAADPAPADPPAEALVEAAPAAADLAPAAEAPDASEPTADRPRGPDGKFLPKDAAAVTPGPAPDPTAPLPALLDERDKRQKAERERDAAQERIRALEAAQPAAEEQPPLSPEGLALNTKLDISEDLARDKHGDEMIDRVQAWAKSALEQNPSLMHEVMSNRNPYRRMVEEFQRHEVLESLKPGDIDEFNAWRAQRASGAPLTPSLEPAPAPALAPLAAPAPPPRSIAAEPSAGGSQHVTTGPGHAYDAVFSQG